MKTMFNLRKTLSKLTLVSALMLSTSTAFANKIAHNELEPCYMDGLDDRLMCGSIKRPLSDNPDDGEIDIHFAIIPAIKPSYPDEAVLGFAGGPGQGAIELAAVFNRNLRFARESRDILLVDQRGTGFSHKLQCESDDLTSQFAFNDVITDLKVLGAEETLKCKNKLNIDLSHFTTSVAAKDFEAVKNALGYKGLHLYGVSYGTRIAQEYTRQFPESVLSSTLDGVVAMQQSLALIGDAVDDSLTALFTRCENTPRCNAQYPELKNQFNTLLAQLDANPVTTQVKHPRTSENIELVLTKYKLYGAIRIALYSQSMRALVPLAISEAKHGNYAPVVGLMSGEGLSNQLAMGMHNAIVCSEDWPLMQKNRELYTQSYMGALMVSGFDVMCPLLDVALVDEAFYKPLQSDTPTLLLSGGRDPATPPSWAELAMVNMTNATHLIAPTATHDVGSQTCAPKIIAQFIANKSMQDIDTQCIEDKNDKAFFININGAAAATAQNKE
ncbi:alpha/beta fold hydrolase [Pseudoalteromonas sp. MMG010]|uniref:alpha/beta fold hydrolase n=1 Tax=Pseudoalteromonas sp. MMG010 TaxID=2822685 RepID=UPI001B3A797A|nr:alpha/beta fold hydrolase [Pseudoalteromonas sp. MMG010]MBQ4832035.1 alpha/beta fold hydrolase [Pseudoalteromonas sp. MMG010]